MNTVGKIFWIAGAIAFALWIVLQIVLWFLAKKGGAEFTDETE